jgi:3-hydroxyacyl-CoA dehydrogenase
MSITPSPLGQAKGVRFEHGSVLGGKTWAARVSSQWKSTHALWREAIALVAEGVCDAKTVDDVVKASFGARLAVLGPLENADLVGVDLTKSIHSYVLPTLDRSTTPSPYLDRLIDEGRLGFKSGEGFHRWTPGQQQALRERVTKHLKASFGAPIAIEE